MRYSLSPMDYYFFRPNLYTIQFLFEYSGRIDSEKLQLALKETATIYRPIRCKLRSISDHVLELEEDKEPFPLSIIELHEKPSLHVSSEVDKFIDEVSNLPGNPLFKIRINYFKNQTYLGISLSHMLGDGYSFMSLMKTLSRLFNNLQVEEIPCFDRTLLYENDPEKDYSRSLERLFVNTGYITPRPKPSLDSKLEKIIFTYEELKALQQEANRLTGRKISPNSLIMASLLKRFHHHIPLTEDGKLIVRCPVDYRKIYSKIPSNYFGNAVRDAVTSFEAVTFNAIDLIQVAEEIQLSIENLNEMLIYKSLQALDDLRLEHTTSIFNELGCPGLLVSNLSRFPFHEINFGVGGPIAIHHASQNPRLAIVLPHTEGFEVHLKVPL